MTMTREPEDVIQAVILAFEQRALPGDDPVLPSTSVEIDAPGITAMARQMRWIDLPHPVLAEQPLVLAFATPPAFAWFLPACLCAAVVLAEPAGELRSVILTCLTPPDEADAAMLAELEAVTRRRDPGLLDETPADALAPDDQSVAFFTERVALLTATEKAAVRDYLEWCDDAYGPDFPVFGPRLALDRYWAAAGGRLPRSGGAVR